jgi:hypothetical protein
MSRAGQNLSGLADVTLHWSTRAGRTSFSYISMRSAFLFFSVYFGFGSSCSVVKDRKPQNKMNKKKEEDEKKKLTTKTRNTRKIHGKEIFRVHQCLSVFAPATMFMDR